MPIYKYQAKNKSEGCSYCRNGFEILQNINDKSLKVCPECGSEVRKVFSEFSLGFSKTELDREAKEKGFHKLKKIDKNKYRKLY